MRTKELIEIIELKRVGVDESVCETDQVDCI